MKVLLLLVVLMLSLVGTSQDISGEWSSEKVNAYKLQNGTAKRVYTISINKQQSKISGNSKITYNIRSGSLGTILLGTIDTFSHTLFLRTENFKSSVDGTEEHMKDGNKYNWMYKKDSLNEYLFLERDEQFPHILLDSNIVFSRALTTHEKNEYQAKIEAVKPKDTSIVTAIHPVTTRANKLYKEITVDTNLVKIDLYDVGEIDGDSVSLFLNGKMVAEHQMLKANARTFYITLDKNLPENKLVLFAENLGRIPPNTAYMVITSNKKEYTLNMQSDEKTNGEVVFRFSGQ